MLNGKINVCFAFPKKQYRLTVFIGAVFQYAVTFSAKAEMVGNHRAFPDIQLLIAVEYGICPPFVKEHLRRIGGIVACNILSGAFSVLVGELAVKLGIRHIPQSGGEEQKLAIARALYKDGAFVVLDEPTAALDPIAESEIYSKFNEIVGNKSAVYISHRLSSCRFCSRIIVFDKGEIIQQGTHEELHAQPDGKYYKLWNAQAQYYQDNATA